MKVKWTTLYLLLASCWLMCGNAVAQTPAKPKSNPALDDAMQAMFGVREFQQASISPDGKHVAWVESLPGPGNAPS
jgi:hypothetical protein